MKLYSSVLAFTALLTLSACNSSPQNPDQQGTGPGVNRAPTVSVRTADNKLITSDTFLQPGSSVVIIAEDDKKVANLSYSLVDSQGNPVALQNGGIVTSIGNINRIQLPTNLGEGTYTLTAIATDNEGLKSGPATAAIRVDATDPIFTAVTLNGQPAGSATVTTSNVAILNATATDRSGPVTLTVKDGNEVLAQRTDSINVDLAKKKDGTARQPGQYSFTLIATDVAGRTTERAISINLVQQDNNAGPVEQTPTPVFQIIGKGPFSGNIAVNASANVGPASQLDKMVLVVTDSENRSESYVTTDTNQTFSVDTTKFANGPIRMYLVAFTKSGLEGRSGEQTVEVQNINAPKLSIVAPINGTSFNGPTLPVRITITKSSSDYTLTDGKIYVQLLDYRGSLKATRVLDATNKAQCTGDVEATLTCDTTFDMADGDAGLYTVRAFTTADVELLGQQVLEANSRFTSTVQNASAPANNIVMPVRISGDAMDVKVIPNASARLPILNRNSGITVEASDDDGLKYMQLRFLYPDGRPVNSYLLNRDLDGTSAVIASIMPIEVDGSEYIPDGLYILQLTTEDVIGNTNIQEIWVRVNRNLRGQRFTESADYFGPRSLIAGQLEYSAGVWKLDQPLNTDSRIVAINYHRAPNNQVRVIGKNTMPTGEAGQLIENRIGFNTEGTYWTDWMIQDVNTGVVESIHGTELSVRANN